MRLTVDQPIKRTIVHELPSEGAVPGSVQVPPSGQPVLFLADHPQTGGYPVVGALRPIILTLQDKFLQGQ